MALYNIDRTKLPPINNKIKEILNRNKVNKEDEVVYNIDKQLSFKKIEEKKEITMENFFETTVDDYKDFEERAWNKGDGYKIPNFKAIEDKLEGVDSGFYVIAGESNSGKSAFMMNLLKDICSYKPNKLFGIYYSLDDSKNEIIPRIISMEQSIPISVASKPKRYQNMVSNLHENSLQIQEWLDKRQIGLDKLKDESNLFKVEDTEKIKNSTDLREHIMKVQVFIKSIDPKMNIVIAIDAINDIKLDPKYYNLKSEDNTGEIARFVKDLSSTLDIIIFGSCHLRKLNGNRRPTVDDLREANTLLYEASLVWLVYNDVSKNKGAAKIYWNQPNSTDPGPVVEIDWGKNKKSSYKGRTFYMFYPNFSKLIECKEEDMKRYDALIYQQ